MAVFVEVRDEANYSHEFIEALRDKIRDGAGQFEFKWAVLKVPWFGYMDLTEFPRVLEAILYDVIVELEAEQAKLIPPIQKLLDQLGRWTEGFALRDPSLIDYLQMNVSAKKVWRIYWKQDEQSARLVRK